MCSCLKMMEKYVPALTTHECSKVRHSSVQSTRESSFFLLKVCMHCVHKVKYFDWGNCEVSDPATHYSMNLKNVCKGMSPPFLPNPVTVSVWTAEFCQAWCVVS